MASSSARPCLNVPCKRLVRHGDKGWKVGRCDAHADAHLEELQERDRARGTRTERGYNNDWYRASRAYLKQSEHALCRACEKQGRVTAATCVDHVVPHHGDPDLFWNEENWQPLCQTCHSKKTAREDGGFGNRIKADRVTP